MSAHSWQKSVGMFANDPVFEEISAEGRRLRQQDRGAGAPNGDLLALRHRAMSLAEQAFAAQRDGDPDAARSLFALALENEREAAEAAGGEPTRSILFRSAATLACDCGEWEEAERLVAAGLAGDPPGEIAAELREVSERAKREAG